MECIIKFKSGDFLDVRTDCIILNGLNNTSKKDLEELIEILQNFKDGMSLPKKVVEMYQKVEE